MEVPGPGQRLRGGLAIRGGTARSVLLRLAAGDEPARACAAALAETAELPDEFRTPLQCLCLTPDGRHGGASTNAGASCAVMTRTTGCWSGGGHEGFPVQ